MSLAKHWSGFYLGPFFHPAITEGLPYRWLVPANTIELLSHSPAVPFHFAHHHQAPTASNLTERDGKESMAALPAWSLRLRRAVALGNSVYCALDLRSTQSKGQRWWILDLHHTQLHLLLGKKKKKQRLLEVAHFWYKKWSVCFPWRLTSLSSTGNQVLWVKAIRVCLRCFARPPAKPWMWNSWRHPPVRRVRKRWRGRRRTRCLWWSLQVSKKLGFGMEGLQIGCWKPPKIWTLNVVVWEIGENDMMCTRLLRFGNSWG